MWCVWQIWGMDLNQINQIHLVSCISKEACQPNPTQPNEIVVQFHFCNKLFKRYMTFKILNSPKRFVCSSIFLTRVWRWEQKIAALEDGGGGTSFLFSDSPPAAATVHCPLTTTTSNSSRTSSSTSNSASGDGQWRRTCYNRTNKCDKYDKCGVDYSEAMIKVEKDSWSCPACNLVYPSHLHSFLIPLYCCCQLSSANKLKQRLENLFWKMKLHCVQSFKV